MKWLKKLFCLHDWKYVSIIRRYIDRDFFGKKRQYVDWNIECKKCGDTSVATTVGDVVSKNDG